MDRERKKRGALQVRDHALRDSAFSSATSTIPRLHLQKCREPQQKIPPKSLRLPSNAFFFGLRTLIPYVYNTAVPFAFSKDDAVRRLASGSKGRAPSSVKKFLPDFESGPLQPTETKAMYLPVWFIDGEVTGKVIKSGTEVRGVEVVRTGYGSMDN